MTISLTYQMLSRMIGAMVMVEAAVIVIANNANVCKIMRTNPVNTYFSRSSFTLIELLIVLAVLSILSITVILTINPSEFLKQARDSTRLSDMANINSSLNLFVVDSPDASLGTASTTYISIPDPTATSTAGTQCQGLGLSELPSGWTYHCAATSTYRNTDGTGWVPVNFQSMSFGSTLGTLPIDPINTTTSGNYYTYTPGGSWQLTATPESNKVRTTQADQTTGAITKGTDLTLSPLFNPSGLVGYWKFDEGSGASSADNSGGNNTVTVNSATWTSGKFGSYAFYIQPSKSLTYSSTSSIPTTNLTVSAWVKVTGHYNWKRYLNEGWGASNFGSWLLYSNASGIAEFGIIDSAGSQHNAIGCSTTFTAGVWHLIIGTYDGANPKVYLDGQYCGQATSVSQALYTNSKMDSAESAGGTGYSIDEVRIYNRALSAAEIYALYGATR